MAQLQIAGLNKSYGNHPILRDVTLEVEAGEFMTIVGPSGCGKSTLLRIVAGLEAPDSGSLALGGLPAGGLAPRDRNVSMVFQTYALYPHKTVRENIAMPLKMRQLSFLERLPLARHVSHKAAERHRDIHEAVEKAASLVSLGHVLERRPAQLSGGQRQRVAVARAVVREARLMLMDEPFSNLDAALRIQLRDEIARLHKALGNTVLFVTHDAAEAMTLSDRIAVMAEGRILQTGRPQDLYTDPAHLTVARLLGQTSLNILPAHWRGYSLGLAGWSMPMDKANDGDAEVTVGIRPEGLTLQLAGAGQGIAAAVTRIMYVGCDSFVEVRSQAGDHLLLARCPPHDLHCFPVGTIVTATVPAGQCFIFDNNGVRRRGRVPELESG